MKGQYWRNERDQLQCRHGVILYGASCLRCERGEKLIFESNPGMAGNPRIEAALNKARVKKIFDRYWLHYDGEVQGLCLVIADEIRCAIGGTVVAGFLIYGSSNRRSHWWVEKNGVIYDPMAEYSFVPSDNMTRHEVHRDRLEFDYLLRRYEQWRLK